jgi:hypothetical protein
MYGTWTDTGNGWKGSTGNKFHFGPARLWKTPINSSEYGEYIVKLIQMILPLFRYYSQA